MAGEAAAESWYVRARGRVLGPLSWEQLQALASAAGWPGSTRSRATSRAGPRPIAWNGSSPAEEAVVHSPCPAGRRTRVRGEAPNAIPKRSDFSSPTMRTRAIPPRLPATGHRRRRPTSRRAGITPRPGHRRVRSDSPSSSNSSRTPGSGQGRSTGRVAWTSGPRAPTSRSSTSSGATRPIGGRDRRDDIGPAWGDHQPGPAAVAPRVNPLAIVSLALNLICGVGNIAGIVVGIVALRQIARSNGALGGKGLAVGGIALGIAGVGISVLAYLGLFARGTG